MIFFLARIPPKIGNAYPLDKDDFIESMTAYDNKEVGNDEVGGEVQLLEADLIREGLKFAKGMEHYFLADDQ
ncbi:hypothetical protein TNCV_48001 [Trichonephila clavipes]|nr:hypothetical protein TNCV_48001 [Trichonephila clavipes]